MHFHYWKDPSEVVRRQQSSCIEYDDENDEAALRAELHRLDQLLVADPHDPPTLMQRSSVLAKLHMPERALEDLDTLIVFCGSTVPSSIRSELTCSTI